MKLEDLRPQAIVRGILPDRAVTVVHVQWFGTDALELTYKDPAGAWETFCFTGTMNPA